MLDALDLRQTYALRHGGTLTHGGSLGAWREAQRAVRHLARVTGLPRGVIEDDLRSDYEALGACDHA